MMNNTAVIAIGAFIAGFICATLVWKDRPLEEPKLTQEQQANLKWLKQRNEEMCNLYLDGSFNPEASEEFRRLQFKLYMQSCGK
jgi:hypothetical protein